MTDEIDPDQRDESLKQLATLALRQCLVATVPIAGFARMNGRPVLGPESKRLIVRFWVVAVEGHRIRIRPPGAIHLMRWRSHKRTIVNGWVP